ncbi:MAG: AMP-binding protein [Chloroflexi bacterium]|nr:AMP-binding protein [Chloroflexota bacterium]
MLSQAASRLPQKVAVIDGEREFTFSQLDEKSDRLAAALAGLGVEKADRVGLFAPNCAEFIIGFFGIIKAGATVTPVNAAYRERELAHQLGNAGAKVIIAHQALLPVVQAARGELPELETVIVIGEASGVDLSLEELLSKHRPEPPRVSIDPREDLAVLPSSSGTTGLPKGVMLTHFNLTSNLEQFLNRPGEASIMREEDVVLVHLPLFHSYGMTVLMNAAIASGATQVHMARFDMEQFLALCSRHRVTMLVTVPPVILLITQVPDIEKYDLSSMRVCISGAAPLSEELQQRLEGLTGIPTIQGYGLTETSPITNLDYLEPERRRSGSIGPALADTEEKVVDSEDGVRELPRGEVGELLIKGPQVMKGYWMNPEETAETIKDGWLYTGDLARMDEEGYVYIVDRKKELIKYKGFQVAPAEMEALLLEHPQVLDVAVVGKPDVEAGELPKAYVVAKGTGLTADCTGLEIDPQGNFVQVRPAFSGNILAHIRTRTRPQMATVRYKIMSSLCRDTGRQGEIIRQQAEILPSLLTITARENRDKTNITEAEVIVSGGAGLQKAADFSLLSDLAGLLGGTVGSSRRLVDSGWIGKEHQVGFSGHTVKPRIYIACGISGSPQHLAGMRESDIIIAINSDPSAPIFKIADYGIIGDLYEVVPRLIDRIKRERCH